MSTKHTEKAGFAGAYRWAACLNSLWCAERVLRSIGHPLFATAVPQIRQILPSLVSFFLANTPSSSHLEVVYGHHACP